jgi:glyoxylase-like metal-dependent hydrolase (beta-lactamase superfamily II)
MTYKVKNACVNIEFLVMGMIDNNVYIVDDGEGCFVVDPSIDADRILEAIGQRTLDAIVITHGHWDHIGAAADLRAATGARVIASAADTPAITGEAPFGGHIFHNAPCVVDEMLEDGDVVEVGSMKWRVIATPGHTMGSVCFYLEPADGQSGAPVLISGDTLFAGTCGRTDFPESDPKAMHQSLARLRELPDETIVLPGHNNLSVMSREKTWQP